MQEHWVVPSALPIWIRWLQRRGQGAELKGQYISEELEHMIQERKQRTAKIGEKHYVQAVQGMGEFCLETICPIISGGDVTGAVLLLEKEEKKNPELDEKMAQGAADFLGRQMG